MFFILSAGEVACLYAISVINSSANTMKLIAILIVKQGIYDLYYDNIMTVIFYYWVAYFFFEQRKKKS